MKPLILYLFFVSPFLLISQEVLEIKNNILEVGVFVEGLNDPKYDRTHGSKYLTKEFVPAKINEIVKTQFIRINAVDQIVEVKTKRDKVIMLDLKYDFNIQLLDESGSRYKTATFFYNNSKIKSFFEIILVSKHYTLFRQRRKKFLKAQKEAGYQEQLPARFINQDPVYFISDFKTNSGHLLELPQKKKKFLSFFGSDDKIISKFMKQENLRVTKSDDLIQLLNFFFKENK